MKAEELMIGDWVFLDGVPSRVGLIEENPQTVYVKNERLGIRVDMEYVDPIPLTDEILEANGWERTGGASHRIYGDYNAVIFHWNENRKEIIIDKNGDRHHMLKLDLLYVHQLQHALRLCGIEKKLIISHIIPCNNK